MASDELYRALAEALSRPSRAYRTAQAAIDVPQQAAQGYMQGSEMAETIRRRRRAQQTLSEALGGNVPESISGYGDINVSTLKDLGGLDALGKLTRPREEDQALKRMMLQQEAIEKRRQLQNADVLARQKDRQDFVREMVGAKGNKDAVNQAKNAAQGIGYVNQLFDEMAKLGDLEKAAAGNQFTEKLFPKINTLKKNVRRTAGFSEGGKNLTANELEVVVESFEPTTLDDAQSRALKRQIATDFFLGTVDLFEAAKLLGPAGAKLQEIARRQQQRQGVADSAIKAEAGIPSEIDDPFAAEGL